MIMKKLSQKILLSFAAAALIMGGSIALPAEYCNPSLEVYAETADKLAAPQNITYTSTVNSVTISWDKVSKADAYRVYKYDESQKKYIKYKNVSGSSCKVTDLQKNKTYYFKVAALTEKSGKYYEQERSGQITVKTKANAFPAAPSKNYTGFAESNNKKYYFSNGKVCTGFKKINNNYYYFTDEGYMLTGWLDYYGVYYYFQTDGKMAAGKSLKFGKTTYTFENDGKTAWYSYLPEPKASYTKKGSDPKFSIYMLDEPDYTGVIVMNFSNMGSKDIKISSVGELKDHDYSVYDRTIGLGFRGYDEIPFETQILKAGDSSYFGWVCVPDDTWYDKKTTITFLIKYDNATYKVSSSSYYGTYYDLAHFDLDDIGS